MLARFGIRLPADLVVLSRVARDARRDAACDLARLSLVAAASDLMAAPDSRIIDRTRCCATSSSAALPQLRRLPDRIDRILTLTGRGELRIRHVVDEDGRRIVRTLANRALLCLVGLALLVVVGAPARRRGPRARGRRRHRAVRGPRLRRPARRDRAAAAGRGGGRTGRHHVTLLDRDPRPCPRWSRRPTPRAARRALLPPPGRRAPARVLGHRHRARRAPRAARDRHDPRAHERRGPARRTGCR